MNRNIIIGLVIAVLVIVGVVVYAATSTNSPSTVATSTPTGTVVDQTPAPQQRQPGAPTVVTGTSASASDTTVVLTGAVTPNGSFTSYWYEYGTSQALGNKSVNQTLGSGYTAISAPVYITRLVKDTAYFFRLAAENQYGKVEGAIHSFQTTHDIPAPVGSSPTIKTLAANGISRTAANVNGEVLPNKAPTTYWFEYGPTANLGSITAFQSVGDGNTTLSASSALVGLDPATTYYFRIDAQNQFGTVSGSIVTFKTAGPAALPAPTVTTRNTTSIATSSATLRGNVNPNGVDTTYWFEYSTNALLTPASLQTTSQVSAGSGNGVVSVTANVSNLARTTTYYARLVAQNSTGVIKGDSVSFRTK